MLKLTSRHKEGAEIVGLGLAGCLIAVLGLALNLAIFALSVWVAIKILFWTGALPL